MKVAAPRAVLFDLDGTFVDSAPDMAQALNVLRDCHGHPPLPLAQVRPYVSQGARGMLDVGFGLKPGCAQFDALRDDFLSEYAQKICVDTCLFDGMPALIDHLEQRGIVWGIVTNKARLYAQPIAEQLGFASRAACLVCGDTTAHTKPHPASLLHAAEILRVSPADCWYVGDDERDMLAARDAGMVGVIAGYGYLGGTPHHTWPSRFTVETVNALHGLLIDA